MCSFPSPSEPPPAFTPVDTASPGYGGEGLSHGGKGYVFSWVDSVASLQAFLIYVHAHTHTQALRPLFLHTSTLSTLRFYFPLPYKLCAGVERTVLFFPGSENGCSPSSNNTREDSTHGHHQMVNTEIRLIICILCSQRWRSSIQSAKRRPGAQCGSDHEILIAKFRVKLKKVGKNH